MHLLREISRRMDSARIFQFEGKLLQAWGGQRKSETGRIWFRRARLQTPNSVSFLALTEFRGASSGSSSRPTIFACQSELTEFSQNSPSFAPTLSEAFSSPKQYSRNSIPPVSQKSDQQSEKCSKKTKFPPIFFVDFSENFPCMFFCSENSKRRRKTVSKIFNRTTIKSRMPTWWSCKSSQLAFTSSKQDLEKNRYSLQLAALHPSSHKFSLSSPQWHSTLVEEGKDSGRGVEFRGWESHCQVRRKKGGKDGAELRGRGTTVLLKGQLGELC